MLSIPFMDVFLRHENNFIFLEVIIIIVIILLTNHKMGNQLVAKTFYYRFIFFLTKMMTFDINFNSTPVSNKDSKSAFLTKLVVRLYLYV